jgi:hypothetical protein
MIDCKVYVQTGVNTLNILRLFFVISLSLLFLAGSSLSLACLCNKCLPISFQDLDSTLKSAVSKGSSGNNQKICNFINRAVTKGGFSKEQIPGEKSFPTFTVSNPPNYYFDRFQISPASFIKNVTIPVAGLYLKNLSLRC